MSLSKFRKSESAPQPDIDFYRGLAGNCGNRKADARQKAVKSCQRNSKYNIRTECNKGVTKHRANYDDPASFAALASRDALTQDLNHPLQPDMIRVGDDRADQESRRHHPAEPKQANNQAHAPQ